jgi:hypothetical protein
MLTFRTRYFTSTEQGLQLRDFLTAQGHAFCNPAPAARGAFAPLNTENAGEETSNVATTNADCNFNCPGSGWLAALQRIELGTEQDSGR